MDFGKRDLWLIPACIMLAVAVIAAVIAVMLVWSAWDGGHSGTGNTDPRRGPVEVSKPGHEGWYYATKQCDGTTLVYAYVAGGGSAVPNSPECAP